jgi:hypothetical protein
MKKFFLTGSLMAMLVSCSTISKFDQYAYTQSTSLKVDAINVMGLATDSFSLHQTDVAGVQTAISKMLEYERNRPKNVINEKMWTLIQDSTGHLFGGFIARWQKNGKLDTVFVKESQQLIGSTFDQISQLESGKIKPTQVTN